MTFFGREATAEVPRRFFGNRICLLDVRGHLSFVWAVAKPSVQPPSKNIQLMSSAAHHDPDAGLSPAFPAPKGACDAHFHVFGPAKKYPHVTTDLRYKPPHEPLEAFLKLAKRIGFERFVFVQPSAYGLDNSCMFDAMAEMDPAVRRGICHLDETSAKDPELSRRHALGVCGVRINVSPIRQPEARTGR
jgi:hypothetical protein